MRKVVNPCTCKVYGRMSGKESMANAFAEIKFEAGRLSICGVIGPQSNGDCRGSAGQCTDEIRSGTPVEGWTREMLDKFCDIWDRWHLNDMNPCCEHQRKLGWLEEASQPITLYHYRLTREASEAKRAAEKAADEALREGETFTPTESQTFFASLPAWLDTYDAPEEKMAPFYEPKKPLYPGDTGATETQLRGHVWYGKKEDSSITRICCEDGILCKPCPVCGYKYGTAWQKEEVPKDVIDWLFALPETTRRPAWV